MVRLKAAGGQVEVLQKISFNSLMVRLKGLKFRGLGVLYILFQFPNGSIKSRQLRDDSLHTRCVSIP